MLRRLKIGGRVNMLIAVPLLALIAFAALGYVALERSSVRGDEYKALKEAQDLRRHRRTSARQLAGSLGEREPHRRARGNARRFHPHGQAQIDGVPQPSLDEAQVKFEESMAYWSQQDLDPRVRIRLIEMGGDAGRKFFEQVNDELKPAIAGMAPQNVIAMIKQHGVALQPPADRRHRALEWAEPEVDRS
jgi:hypothetical protein